MAVANNPYDFSVMTINMNGPGKALDKRKAVNLTLEVSKQDDSPFKPAIIFAQEIGAPGSKDWKLNLHTSHYDYDRGSTHEAGILWLEKSFTQVKPYIDAGFKARVRDKFNGGSSFPSDIPARLNAVVLEHTTKTYKLLAVSWHGPSKIRQRTKLYVFRYLQQYVKKMIEMLGDPSVKCILIGGDFNLDFGYMSSEDKQIRRKDVERNLISDFFYQTYIMSDRRTSHKKKLIDNFLYMKNSMSLSDTIQPMIFMRSDRERPHWKERSKAPNWAVELKEGVDNIKALDHDPVMAYIRII